MVEFTADCVVARYPAMVLSISMTSLCEESVGAITSLLTQRHAADMVTSHSSRHIPLLLTQQTHTLLLTQRHALVLSPVTRAGTYLYCQAVSQCHVRTNTFW